jgi:hydroxymethylpyrimidine/phosphomethylpyrimidine kinase
LHELIALDALQHESMLCERLTGGDHGKSCTLAHALAHARAKNNQRERNVNAELTSRLGQG